MTCDKATGKCVCKADVAGDNCDMCPDGLYGFPDCQGTFQIIGIPFKSQYLFDQTADVVVKGHWTRANFALHKELVSVSQGMMETSVTNARRDSISLENTCKKVVLVTKL